MRAARYLKDSTDSEAKNVGAGRPKGARNTLTIAEKRSKLKPIQPTLDYNQIQISEMTGISLKQIRLLIKHGLPSRMIGDTRMILGSDWITWTRQNIDSNGKLKDVKATDKAATKEAKR